MTSPNLPPWKALRDASGLSQREIERRVGMKPGRLSVIERGLIPTDDEAKRLKSVLIAAIESPSVSA